MSDNSVRNQSEFREYFCDRIDDIKDELESDEKEIQEFILDYPISRLSTLSADEYCLGTANSKESLSYLIEFGKYKWTGFGIGGGSAK